MTAIATTTTSTDTVAREFVAVCRAGRNEEAIEKLYSPDIVSIESMGSEEMPAEMHGIDAIRAKNEWWTQNNEVHSAKATGPFIGRWPVRREVRRQQVRDARYSDRRAVIGLTRVARRAGR